ncbi:MAG TPA: alpha/beta fold hydrolase [Patescibacteria group bacterium]|nr:alpha/beta fold hydrolase [Patescibacteria group bacterium]
MKRVQISSDVVGYMFDSSNQGILPAVLLIHGWTSGQDRFFKFAEELTALGFVCVTFDMRGHGESEGSLDVLTFEDFEADVLAAYDFLAAQPQVDPERISVIGSSFGGYQAALLSAKRNIHKLILRAPADYPDSPGVVKAQVHGAQDVDVWRQQKRDFSQTAALRALHNYTGLVLIVESGQDTIVPRQVLQNYADAVADKSKLTYIVMKGAPHSLKGYPQFLHEFSHIVTDFLKTK